MNARILVAGLSVLFSCSFVLATTPPVRIAGDASIPNPRQPQVAVDERGHIHVTFGAADTIYCATSTNAGKNFESPVKVASLHGLALGMRRGPRIAAGRDVVVISAISHAAGDLRSWRSTDGGKTWQESVQVNDAARDAREGMHAMAIDLRGNLYCAWLDLRSQKTEIYGARSTDGGKTWSINRKIYRSPSGSVCECCHPSITYDSEGRLYAMWRNSVDGARDMYYAVSRDGGETFASAEKLGLGTWNLNACPMDGGSLAAVSAGQLITIWRRDQEIFRTDSSRPAEDRLGIGQQPWVVAAPGGPWYTWVSRRGGDLWLLTPDSGKPIKFAEDASEPVIAAPATGTGPVILVWESGTGEETSIMCRVVGS